MNELPETNDDQNRNTEGVHSRIDVRRQRELFEQALVRPNQQAQREFLEASCHDDPQMLASVESLLQLYSDDQSHWLNNDLFETAFVETVPEFQPGTRIDGYELKELLGSGGMGTVWLADQRKPVERQVAIKLIRAGRESSGFLQRFAAERRALAAMKHPNIAAIYDAGATDHRQPYFAMELVDGCPVDEYCGRHDLSVRKRLELFVPICRAVEHAHQKGIIHRDLKPTNVLISEVDGEAVPKIIDFGLARALADDASEQSGLTQAGILLGTPDYMAPEQARFVGRNVDVRSDVYSLGTILFELLTLLRLHGDARYAAADFDNKLQTIREFEPQRPSSRLAAAGDSQEPMYAGMNRQQCGRVIKGELDWIVIKSLENDKNRRYQSAGELCADVERFLNSEAILAHPPSQSYRFRKFLRRNRGLVAAVGSVLLVLILGLVGTTYGLISANRATEVAIEQRNKATRAVEAATKSAQLEKEQREYSDAIVDFLKNDLLLLTTVEGQLHFDSVDAIPGQDATLQELLNRASEKLCVRDDLAPQVRAELAWTIGTSQRKQGNYSQAVELLQESMKFYLEHRQETPDEYLNCANSLSVALSGDKKTLAAIEVLEAALGDVAGNDQIDSEVFHATRRSLAANYRDMGELGRSREILEGVYADGIEQFGIAHRDTILSLLALARCDHDQAKLDSAAQRYQQVMELSRQVFGEFHPFTFSGIFGYIKTSQDLSKADAGKLLQKSLALAKKHLGDHHPKTIAMTTHLGVRYWSDENYERAIAVFSDLAESNAEHFGDDHLFTVNARSNLAMNYRDSGNVAEAIKIFESLLQYDQKRDETVQNLADTYGEAGDKDAFLNLIKEPLRQAREVLAAKPRQLAQLLWHLGADAMAFREYPVANKLVAESLQLQMEIAPDHYQRYIIEFTYASTLFFLGKLDAAQEPIESAYEGLLTNRNKHPIVERRLREVVGSLIILARKTGNAEDLKKWQQVKEELFGLSKPGTQ